MNFEKYQHLERLGTDGVEGIEIGVCYIFPKLDGTNASVWLGYDGEIKSGSRNRELSFEKDNAGFHKWVIANENLLRPFFEEYPTYHLYGEWLVPHSLKTYREDAWHNFYIFDVTDENGDYLHYDQYKVILDKFGFTYLPPIQIIKNGTHEQFRQCVDKNVFLIQENKGIGEGIVIKNYDFVNRFGKVNWAKIVTNAFKEINHREMGAPVLGGMAEEEKIVDEYVTLHLIDKTYSKIVTENDGWQSRFIPQLLNRVFYDLITEEVWDILKKFKNPRVDFQFMQRLTIQKIKEAKPELF